jgi:subtilisin family serine protease
MATVLLLASTSIVSGGIDGDTVPAPVQWDKVDERLLLKASGLDEDSSVELVLRLSQRVSLEDVRFQREEVVQRLKVAASSSQARLIPRLEAMGYQVKRSFWITNALLVEGPVGGLPELTRLLEVRRIVDNFEVTLLEAKAETTVKPAAQLTWGLEKIGAGRVWSDLGINGQGIRVCVSDTGVDISHPDLDGRMWTDDPADPTFPGGWIEFDSSGNPVSGSTPHDTQGHGTHTSGTVLGGDTSGIAIGVAPGATLMHALVLPGGGGTFAQVVAGIEWCVSPTDDQGNPAGEPANVHSMSWGALGYFDEFVDPIRNSLLAGTLPVAAAGNCGEGCSNSPGNLYDALAIGASDVDDLIASFSSGEVVSKSSWSSPPADWPDEWVVPLISAPGVNVYSSLPGGGYDSWSGTSMATPHVAGCAALMLSSNPGLTPDEIREVLITTAIWYDTYYPSPPDTRYGWGRLDCFTSVETVAFDSGIRGTVVDQEDAEPVDQAGVTVSSPGILRDITTDTSGSFKLNLKPGTYNLTVERFGYENLTVANITVLENEWVDLNLLLTPLPRGNITGAAYNNATAIFIPGVTVTILNIPVVMASTTDGTGSFAIRKVPEGTYSLRATSPYFLDEDVTGVVVVQGANATVDFYLTPREWVAVMGDQDSSLSSLLTGMGFYVENPDWGDVISEPCRYRTVVVNHPYFPSSTTLNDFIAATDAAGTGVVFLDTWEHTFTGGGIYYLWYYRSDPGYRNYGYDASSDYVYYKVNVSHPILGSFGPGDTIVLENSTYWHDHAWFDQYLGENGTVIAWVGVSAQGELGPGIAVDDRANNRHVLLSSHGVSSYIQPKDWTPEATDVFLNAVNWTMGPSCGNSLAVDYGLDVNPPVGLWYETFQVSVQVKNVGNETGNYTARLYVDSWLEATQTVSLDPGETKTVAFGVNRDPVGTYRVSIGPHRGSFRVRPPRVVTQAYDTSGSPIAGGTIAIGLGTSVTTMGETDANGTLEFDSPGGSHGQYWMVLQAYDVGSPGTHYFLAQDVLVEYDTTISFSPTGNTTSILEFIVDPGAEGEQGQVYIRREDMPKAFSDDFRYPEGSILLDATSQVVWTTLTAVDLQSTWSYDTTETVLYLNSSSIIEYRVGGRFKADVSWSQSGTLVSVDWSVVDAYGNRLSRVSQANLGILQPGETVSHIPFLSLWNSTGSALASGYVDWVSSPTNVTLDSADTVVHIQLDLETGPLPFDNTFDFSVEVLDSSGAALSSAASTIESTVVVRGTALLYERPVLVNVTVNDQEVVVDENGTFSHLVNLTRGINNITVIARDVVGNEEIRSFVIVYKPDVLLLLQPFPAITNVPQLTLEGIVEPGARLTVNDQEVVTDEDGAFSITIELVEGVNTIVIAAVDYLGNRKEVVREVVLDTVPPELTVISPQPGHVTRDENFTIVGTTEPNATVLIDGQVVETEDGLFAHNVSLQEGENSFLLEAVDEAGNVRSMTLTIYREPTVLGVPVMSMIFVAIALAAALASVLFYLWIRKRTAGPGGPEDAEEREE